MKTKPLSILAVAQVALVALVLAVAPARPVRATTCTVAPYPSSGAITKTILDSKLNAVTSCINGGLGDANMSSSDQIAVGKLANQYARFTIPTTVACATSTSYFSTELPYSATLIGCTARCHTGVGVACDTNANHTIAVKVAGTTQCSVVLGAGDLGVVESTSASAAVAANADVTVDVTETAVGTCGAIDVTLHLKAQHST